MLNSIALMVKQGIYQYLKGTTIFIYDDLSKETLTIRKKLRKRVLANRKQKNIFTYNIAELFVKTD